MLPCIERLLVDKSFMEKGGTALTNVGPLGILRNYAKLVLDWPTIDMYGDSI